MKIPHSQRNDFKTIGIYLSIYSVHVYVYVYVCMCVCV